MFSATYKFLTLDICCMFFNHYPLLQSLSFSSQPVRSHLFRYGAVTKAYISGQDKPVLFIVYNATWIDDENTSDSLLIPQRAQEVGITFSTEARPKRRERNADWQRGFPIPKQHERLIFQHFKADRRGLAHSATVRTQFQNILCSGYLSFR
jgi:hypothetical protein